MKKLAIVLAVVWCTVAFAQSLPEGQMRGMVHWHSWRSDGAFSIPTCAEYAKAYGAQFLMMTDHAHKLADSKTQLNDTGVELSKMPIDAVGYVAECEQASSVLPVIPGFEVGKESHFLVTTTSIGKDAHDIVALGRQTDSLGTQKVIDAIGKIVRSSGGFMIEAHPINPAYPFNYNFDQCQGSVGVGFFNGARSEHWKNFDRLLQVQSHSTLPAIATAEADLHVPDDYLTNLGTALGGFKIKNLPTASINDILNYRQSRRFTYLFISVQYPALIANEIAHAACYAAYGDTVITDMTVRPGSSFCPPRDADSFYVSTRGLPQDIDTMRVAFVDDQTHEISQKEVRWLTQPSGTRTAYFSVGDVRRDRTHSGKLFMATTQFVTSAVVIVGDTAAVASLQQPTTGGNNKIGKGGTSTPPIPPPAAQPPVQQPSILSPWESFASVFESDRVGASIQEYGHGDVEGSRLSIPSDRPPSGEDSNPIWMKIGMNGMNETCRISIRFADRQLVDYQCQMKLTDRWGGYGRITGPAPQISARISPHISIRTSAGSQLTIDRKRSSYWQNGKDHEVQEVQVVYLSNATATYRNPQTGETVEAVGILKLWWW